jgi:hypothetical protein
MTPDNFINLGPLQRSLTSDNEIVRNTAFLEVAFFRGFCILAAFVALIVALFRNRLTSSRLWSKLNQHEPELSAVKNFGTFNFSLIVIILLAVTGLMFIFVAPERLALNVIDLIVEEDGVFEYISALLFMASSVLTVVLLFRYQMPFRHRLMLALLAFCLFAFVGRNRLWRNFSVRSKGKSRRTLNVRSSGLANRVQRLGNRIFDRCLISRMDL